MNDISDTELKEALRAIISALKKSEKSIIKLKEGTIQYTFIVRGMKAYRLALALIHRKLENTDVEVFTTKEEIEDAISFFKDVIDRVENILPKFQVGMSQHTLSVRRIQAFQIAIQILKNYKVSEEFIKESRLKYEAM